jgi:hypothetical protein
MRSLRARKPKQGTQRDSRDHRDIKGFYERCRYRFFLVSGVPAVPVVPVLLFLPRRPLRLKPALVPGRGEDAKPTPKVGYRAPVGLGGGAWTDRNPARWAGLRKPRPSARKAGDSLGACEPQHRITFRREIGLRPERAALPQKPRASPWDRDSSVPRRSVRFFAALLTKFQVLIHRIMEGLCQHFDARSLEDDDIPGVQNLSVEETRFRVELEMSSIAFVGQHPFILTPPPPAAPTPSPATSASRSSRPAAGR